MARSRNIKPSFFTNDDLAEINPLGRLLFIALWTLADREGRLEDRPKRIKAEALPYDDADVDGLLDDLQQRGFILRYAMSGNRYIQVLQFSKHQTPHHKEVASVIPPPSSMLDSCMDQACSDDDSSSDDDCFNEIASCPTDSLNLIPESITPPNPPSPGGEGGESPKRERKVRVALKTFIAECMKAGEKPISAYRPLLEYVEATGLPMEFVQLCWEVFKAEHLPPDGVNASRMQADWRKHFLNYVKKGYYRLWYAKADGTFELSTAGVQAKAEHNRKEAA